MRWIDHASDVEARIAERRKTDPSYEEPRVSGSNWRSEDFKWRVAAIGDLTKDPESWTWGIWDMRGQPQPWGPRAANDKVSDPLCFIEGIRTLKGALLLAEVAADQKAFRLAWLVVHMTRQLGRDVKQVWARERLF
jgi:hypothetical protein